jgi:FAD/FMN-containing dehydrogenase
LVTRGFLIYSASKINQCIDLAAALYDTAIESGGKLQMMLSYASPPPTHQPVPLFAVFYDGPEPIARSLMAALYELGPDVDTTTMMPYPAINTLFNSQLDTYKRHGLSSAKLHLPLEKQVLREVWLSYESTIPKYPNAWPSHVVVEIRNIAPGLAKTTSEMAFAGRGKWTNILVHPQWDDPRDDVPLRQWAVELTKMITLTEYKRYSDPGQAISYANYSSGDEKSQEIFGANYSRLRQLKQRYDPNRLFNKWYPIVPAESQE